MHACLTELFNSSFIRIVLSRTRIII